jgi:hypothetical protein
MTTQYLIGELSARLERLQAAVDPAPARDIASLRYQVETGQAHPLTSVVPDLSSSSQPPSR